MAEGSAVDSLENLLRALEVASDVTERLIARVHDAETRNAELAEDVADLGRRLAELERDRPASHSRSVLGFARFRTLDELAATLRAEFAAEVEAITQRIDNVHERALRALTNLTEKGTNA